MGIFSCPCCVPWWCVSLGAGSRGLLKLSQPGIYWKAWYLLESLVFTGKRYRGRWQFLTIHIENVIISVTMITKMLFVTRAPNLRCKAFYGVSL